ncbi:MAG: cell division protein FtsA [Dehalococcoidia bacterium]
MARRGTFAAIDVGTTKVCTLVGDMAPDGGVRIIGVGVSPSAGLSKGMVDNIHEATDAIRVAVEKAERASGQRLTAAHVGIAGAHISSLNNRGIAAIADRDHAIAEDDVSRARECARNVSIPTNRDVLHVIPRYYVVDGQDNVSDPVGMYGQRLDVETHIITGAVSAMRNLTKCVEGAGVQVDSLVLEPLASADSVLRPEELRQGVVLADIGGGTTDVAIFVDGSVFHTVVLPVGGYHLTHDLVVGLRIPYESAERAKQRYGNALPSAVAADELIEVDAFGDGGQMSVHRRRLCEILQARTEEILEMIFTEVRQAGYDEMIAAGLVLTGGSANLPGIASLAADVLNMPVRIGSPIGLQGLIESISNPAYATSVGLLHWAMRDGEPFSPQVPAGPRPAVPNWLKGVKRLMRGFLPE